MQELPKISVFNNNFRELRNFPSLNENFRKLSNISVLNKKSGNFQDPSWTTISGNFQTFPSWTKVSGNLQKIPKTGRDLPGNWIAKTENWTGKAGTDVIWDARFFVLLPISLPNPLPPCGWRCAASFASFLCVCVEMFGETFVRGYAWLERREFFVVCGNCR